MNARKVPKMKTARDLPSRAVDSVDTGNESGRTPLRTMPELQPTNQLGSVSATKNAGLSLPAAQIGATGRYLVDHSSRPLYGIERVPPARNRKGKWVLHAQT